PSPPPTASGQPNTNSPITTPAPAPVRPANTSRGNAAAATTPSATPTPTRIPTVYQPPIGPSVVSAARVSCFPGERSGYRPVRAAGRTTQPSSVLLLAALRSLAPHGEPSCAHRAQ